MNVNKSKKTLSRSKTAARLPGGIRGKFLGFFFLLSLVPIGFISLAGYQMTRNVILQQSYRYLSLQNLVARNEVFMFLQESRNLIAPDKKNNWFFYHRLLEILQKPQPQTRLKKSRDILAWIQQILATGYFTNVWILDREYHLLHREGAGNPNISGATFEKLRSDSLLILRIPSANSRTFFLCLHPVRDDQGRVFGYVIGQINHDKLLDKLPTLTDNPESIRVYILKGPDEVLLCSDRNRQLLAGMRDVRAGNAGESVVTRLPDGRRVIRNIRPIGLLDWQVMSEIEYRTAMHDVIQFRNQAALGVGFLLLVLVVLALYISRRLTIPIQELVMSAQEIGDGNLNVEIRRSSSDEIGQLATEFDEMRRKLKDYYENLEKKVNERTEELRKAQFQLIHQEKMASLGLMAAGIAHEIGNPLTSISSLIQILKRRLKDPTNTGYMDTILENINRISKIVKELVDFSRPTSETVQPTYVNSVIASAVGIIKYDRRAKDIDFHVHLDENIPPISLVADQLQQVLINILVNAVDAMENYGKDLYVRSRLEQNQILIEVQDTGVGIQPEMLRKIFEPFFTTKEVGKGTGLGLTVSYGIIRKFKGDIRVTSQAGKGSVFTIVLPVNQKGSGHES